MPTYTRIDAQGYKEAVLDVNNAHANSELVSIGQVKISPDQQLVAHTVSVADAAEAYDAQIQPIGELIGGSQVLGDILP